MICQQVSMIQCTTPRLAYPTLRVLVGPLGLVSSSFVSSSSAPAPVSPGGHISQEVGVRGRLLLEELPQEAAGDHGAGLLASRLAAGDWQQVTVQCC